MKKLFVLGFAFSLSAIAATGSISQGSGYAPNDGTAKPGNPGTGMGASAVNGSGTDVNGAGTIGSTSTSSSTAIAPSKTSDTNAAETLQTGTDTAMKESVDRANTAVTPVPEDTDDMTLKGKTQTGPYKTDSKQSQESEEDKLDYRSIPKVDHDDIDASENQ